MVRPYKLGKSKVSQEAFDNEVKRLYILGLSETDIKSRLKCSRHTVWRSLKRIQVTPADKEIHDYAKLSTDQFYTLPEIARWIEDLKTRRVKTWRKTVNFLHKVTDELEIYPSMLDLEWSKKWLATKADKDLETIRDVKIAVRQWLKYSLKVSDTELQTAGLDAKHYALRKWAHVRMSPDQIMKAETFLTDKEALFVYRFGIDTCSRKSEIFNMKPEYFTDSGDIISCQIPTGKTEKAGSAWSTGWVTRETYNLALQVLPLHNDNGHIANILRDAYSYAGLEVTYFYSKPFHALRHVGAQRYLELTNWNRAVVARLGHWLAEKTLEDHYGQVPDDVVIKLFKAVS